MVGWMGVWVGGQACRRAGVRDIVRALICALPLISLLVLIWIATCWKEWIHSCTRSTTSVIGCSVEWQPPYVPEKLCRGYNNKPLWEVANKKKTTGIKVHHIITWFLRKLPFPPSASLSIFAFSLDYYVLSSSSLPFASFLFYYLFTLTNTLFHHFNPLKIPHHPKGEVGTAQCFHLPSFPLPHLTVFVQFFFLDRCCSALSAKLHYILSHLHITKYNSSI